MSTTAELNAEIDSLVLQLKDTNPKNRRPTLARLNEIAGELYFNELWENAVLLPVGEVTVIAEVTDTHPLAGDMSRLRKLLKSRFDAIARTLADDLVSHEVKITVTYSS